MDFPDEMSYVYARSAQIVIEMKFLINLCKIANKRKANEAQDFIHVNLFPLNAKNYEL